MAKVKSKWPKLSPKFLFDKTLLAVIAVVVVITSGYLFYKSSHAATCVQVTFRQGSSGSCVSDIQYMLNGANYYYHFAGNPPTMLTVDGKYGPATALIVGGFQAAHRNVLKVDGIVGPQTWLVLCSYGYDHSSTNDPLVARQAYLATVAAGCKP